MLRFLLGLAGADADVNAANSNGWTPLLCALAPTMESWGRPVDDMVETVRLLLSRGADAAAVSDEGWSALHCLASHKSHAGDTRFSALASELIRKGAPLDGRARGLEAGWRHYAGRDGWRWWDEFPWGFRMGMLMSKGVEGVFEGEGTRPVERARRSKGRALEWVLVARGGQDRRSYSSFFYGDNSKS